MGTILAWKTNVIGILFISNWDIGLPSERTEKKMAGSFFFRERTG